jgi:predicted enzyme related to lactoylglutathione lyase
MRHLALGVAAIVALTTSTPLHAETAGRITGLGGVFVKSKDPKALARWYREVLGLPVETWGGVIFRTEASQHPPVTTWNAFAAATDYMAPSPRDFMINFAVDDLQAYLAKLRAKNVPIIKEMDGGATGKFAWILDPDGTKIELWQSASK